MSLIQLIYVSNAVREADAAELASILETAARKNVEHNVTGMLLYAAGSFMQILEGEAAAVDETFERVSRDPRHANIFVLERGPLAQRSFASWRMGFKLLGANEASQHPAYAPFFEHGFNAAEIGAHPGLALDMLRDFARTQQGGARI